MQNCGAKIRFSFVIDKFFALQFLPLLSILLCVMCKYNIEIFSATISVEEYVACYRDASRIAEYCKSCDNYGQSWSCPPFDCDIESRLRSYCNVLLVAMKASPLVEGMSWHDFEQSLMTERLDFEKRLRQLEDEYMALACYPGSCLYCPDEQCARCCGAPCRHPRLMRPSLEAYGFDVAKSVSDILNFPLRWSSSSLIATTDYLTYVAALFHNEDVMAWAQLIR